MVWQRRRRGLVKSTGYAHLYVQVRADAYIPFDPHGASNGKMNKQCVYVYIYIYIYIHIHIYIYIYIYRERERCICSICVYKERAPWPRLAARTLPVVIIDDNTIISIIINIISSSSSTALLLVLLLLLVFVLLSCPRPRRLPRGTAGATPARLRGPPRSPSRRRHPRRDLQQKQY